jgi:thymidylate kinase
VARNNPALLVSFSGIDGAGKSTQIEALNGWLVEAGLRVSNFSMWDDVVAGARIRESLSRAAFGGDQGVGSPEKPLDRRDKNVATWPLQILRVFLYCADAISLWLKIRGMRAHANEDVIIFDRYIYDELANLPLKRLAPRTIARFVLWLVPSPDVAFLIDAVPKIARARKPEYPLEFLHANRERYRALSSMVEQMIVVPSASIADCENQIRIALLSKLSSSDRARTLIPIRR